MNIKYSKWIPICALALIFAETTSCKKDNSITITNNDSQTSKIGLYKTVVNNNDRLLMGVSKLGNLPVDYKLIFDTGSGGMVIDAHNILPASMLSNNGIKFPGDSILINGITVTKQTTSVQYGNNNTSSNTVYGNLAYASVTIGDYSGNVKIKRIPFFIYYKSVDAQGHQFPAHAFDILGVSTESSVVFSDNTAITSPFSYYHVNGLTTGFKMDRLGNAQFTKQGNYLPDAVTIGLTSTDLNSSNFMMTKIESTGKNGYIPYITSTITYNNKTVYSNVLFDTGTSPYSYIEDYSAPEIDVLLPDNSPVSVHLRSGFSYSYSTSHNDLTSTMVSIPSESYSSRSIIGLDFFFKNDFLVDYTNYQIGFRN